MDDNNPEADATIYSTRGTQSVQSTTLANGVFNITNLRAGLWNYRIVKSGYVDKHGTFTVTEQQNINLGNIQIHKPLGMDNFITVSNGANVVNLGPDRVPSVGYDQPIDVKLAGQCVGGSGTWSLKIRDQNISNGTMTENPAGTYNAINSDNISCLGSR